jgi:plastocyanin
MGMRIALFLVAVLPFAAAYGASLDVVQQDKKFAPVKLKIKVGDTVNFKNEDPFFHNVFSLSDVQTFDLGSYPKGQSKAVKFDKPGTVEVGCSIHPDMKLMIEVTK